MPNTRAAGQYSSLTRDLKNNLNNYPSDATIFKEFVQNADDALASEIHFVFDFRPSGDEQVFPEWSKMRSWLGPCLWVYNDAVFSDDDFESIRAYGAGGKQTKAGKIGRFGLGFCSCYNLTDVPHILSGSTCQILDPHRHALPGDGEAMDLNDKQNQQEIKDYPGLLKPFTTLRVKDVPALDLQRLPYQGTLFRLPFRTEETFRLSFRCQKRSAKCKTTTKNFVSHQGSTYAHSQPLVILARAMMFSITPKNVESK